MAVGDHRQGSWSVLSPLHHCKPENIPCKSNLSSEESMSTLETQGKPRKSRVHFEAEKRLVARPGTLPPNREWTLRTPPLLASDTCLFLENCLRSKHQCPWRTEQRWKGIRTSSSPGVPTACASPYLTAQCPPDRDSIYLSSFVFPNLPKPSFKATSFRIPRRPPSSSRVSLLQTFLRQLSCLCLACFV